MVTVAGAKVRVEASATYPYPPAVRREVRALSEPAASGVDRVCHMNFVLGELFAEAVNRLAGEAAVGLERVDLIGSHGQTIHHLPAWRRWRGGRVRSTLQIGEPSVIAERTGITTVADFRPRDLAAGGQGAPLVPYADHVLFADSRASRVICNIGGIANVTYLPAGGGIEDVLAFDTGPGNMVIDAVVRHATGGRKEFDRDGRCGRSGRVHEGLLAELLKHPYFRRHPPKTTGREQFGTAFASGMIERGRALGLADADLAATATALTARSIGRAYRRLPGTVDEVILCGGGARNPALVELLREALAPTAVRIMDELGVDADAKEAVSFAILAAATVRGQAGNVPSATGAARPVVLGTIPPSTVYSVASTPINAMQA